MSKQKVIAPVVWANAYRESDESGPEVYTPVAITLEDFLSKISVFKGVHPSDIHLFANDAGLVVMKRTKQDIAKAKKDEEERRKNAPILRTVYITPDIHNQLRIRVFHYRTRMHDYVQNLISTELRLIPKNLDFELPTETTEAIPSGLNPFATIRLLNDELRKTRGDRTERFEVLINQKDDNKIHAIATKYRRSREIVVVTLLNNYLNRPAWPYEEDQGETGD